MNTSRPISWTLNCAIFRQWLYADLLHSKLWQSIHSRVVGPCCRARAPMQEYSRQALGVSVLVVVDCVQVRYLDSSSSSSSKGCKRVSGFFSSSLEGPGQTGLSRWWRMDYGGHLSNFLSF